MIDWYQLYLNHPGGNRLGKTIREVCYCKGLVMQAELLDEKCKTSEQLKNRKTLYGHLPPKNIAELKPWDTDQVYLMGPYSRSIRQQQPGGTVILNNSILTCMTIIDQATG